MVEKSNDTWYLIKGFLLNEYEKIFNILKCFCNDNKKVLFKHYFFKMDDLDEEFKLELIEDDFNSFCRGNNLYDPEKRINVEKQIKDILFSGLIKDKNESTLSEDEKKQEMFERLCKGELNEINDELLYLIKELISKHVSEEGKSEINEFINDRGVFRNSEDVSFRGVNKEKSAEYVWYMPLNDTEIKKCIEIEGFFECIVTDDIDNFSNYLYAFEHFEHNDFVLAVNDRCGDFIGNIEPKLKGILNDRNYIEDKETFFRKS